MFFLYAAIAWGITDLFEIDSGSRSSRLRVERCRLRTHHRRRSRILDSSVPLELARRHHAVAIRRAAAPDNHHAHANLADALAVSKRYAEAETEYREAIRLAPDFPDYHFYFGQTLAQSGRLAEAIAEFELTLKRKPGDAADARCARTGTRPHRAADEAIVHLQEAIRIDPSLASAHANLGLALASKGDATGALAAYAKRCASIPRNPQTHSNRAALAARAGSAWTKRWRVPDAQRLEPYSSERW